MTSTAYISDIDLGHVKVSIEYCNKCKWQNRAVWYMQELLMTFDGKINEISLLPNNDKPGTFSVSLKTDKSNKIIYKKRMKKTKDKQDEPWFYDGFPDSKFLKVLIRNELFPGDDLGHLDRYQNFTLNDGATGKVEAAPIEPVECKDCQVEQ
ncbi:hypothetical protein PSN45_004073 [Yamadazyma tenuis]|uniref:Uncharacterized protein n=1 Tax=Candida tenuis (strain ATCC 10573 / BCRC 21748 / CBS 615 / JCM 9827 / NBRC 10315 / NRRL Y-1498 / VKM Y-70) TaxID=590646 RepID=G3B4R4_CANTC|nr:uncharacterized protein CANTEDRAFT_93360 [Yamadazyma tenuis ATCC 10573]EGV63853.1 hypothetical protein CANTEDRAFT_93360 [Yamadazyma tenuis ATCC 10573]WEJ96534.1 hypothetical protein PSN45_004073 [Yamadazyma tenuis]